jgi:DNA-binding MarR family transcriptional regulator
MLLMQMAREMNFDIKANCEMVLSVMLAGHTIRSEVQRQLVAQGLSEKKIETLLLLKAADPAPLTPASLALHTEVSRSAMTDILDSMERRGWVARQRANDDRRQVFVRLCEAGAESLSRGTNVFIQAAQAIVGRIDEGPRLEFVSNCERMQNNCRRYKELSGARLA